MASQGLLTTHISHESHPRLVSVAHPGGVWSRGDCGGGGLFVDDCVFGVDRYR